MNRIRLIHWNAAEARKRARELRGMGYRVSPAVPTGPAALRALRQNPPAGVVIDLSRRPTEGRDWGIAIRTFKETRRVPLVFVGGDPDKTARVRQLLPDASFTSWRRLGPCLREAIARPPANPVVPGSLLSGYSGTPLPKKLGIKPDSTLVLIGAPADFEKTLGELPAGVQVRKQLRGRCDLVIWFPCSAGELGKRIGNIRERCPVGGVWIAWPKKASGVVTDLSQGLVRKAGLATGLVDYKIAAIDATWSGLKFARRKPK